MLKEQFGLKAVGGLICAAALSIHPLFWTLLALIALDFLTGLLVAFITRTLQSDVSRRGVAKKAMCLILVAASEILGHNLHYLVPGAISGELPIGQFVAGFYCVHELISIAENATLTGLPMPKALVSMLGKVQTALENQRLDDGNDGGKSPNKGSGSKL